MLQRYGLTFPSCISAKFQKRDASGERADKAVDIDNEGWESEVEHPTQWTRKRSYINRLKKQNQKWCSKAQVHTRAALNKPFAPTVTWLSDVDVRAKEERLPPALVKTSEKSMYFVTMKPELDVKVEALKAGYPSISKHSTMSKEPEEDWELVRRKHVFRKFDRFTKGILNMTGKLSKETVNEITSKLRENLEYKGKSGSRRNKCSKKKTVGFIKKILEGTSVKIPTYAPRRKKPQRKHGILRHGETPLRANSSLLPNLIYLYSCRTAKSEPAKTSNKNVQTVTTIRNICRTKCELLKRSPSTKSAKWSTESSLTLLPREECSTIEITREMLNDRSGALTKPAGRKKINLRSFKQASSKKVVISNQHDQSESGFDLSCSSVALALKYRHEAEGGVNMSRV